MVLGNRLTGPLEVCTELIQEYKRVSSYFTIYKAAKYTTIMSCDFKRLIIYTLAVMHMLSGSQKKRYRKAYAVKRHNGSHCTQK